MGREGGYPLDSVGLRMPDVNMKIDGSGEICIKSPVLFKKYISPHPDATNNAFVQRVSLKREILEELKMTSYTSSDERLKMLSDTIYGGYMRPKSRSRSPRSTTLPMRLSLASKTRTVDSVLLQWWYIGNKIRQVVGSFAEIPVTEAGKPIKNKIRELYFSQMAIESGEVNVWTSEPPESSIGARPFDWGGLQR
ncbi:hypothetical protein PMG11_06039 [Penicillium brasilianum]|uniref:Uncharacterized protein n=1 Tax=Penicillium brasilianum TaxID=104259 RepID=A0A0F7TKN7_PENBI|nr:hypothetical protein PMG11_06039 [Penicillium brasilianum]